MRIYRRQLGHLHFPRPKRENGAIGPYDYIRCGQTSNKVDCSIRSAWVRAGAAFNEIGHSEVWEAQGGTDGHKISFSLGVWVSVISISIARSTSSLIWVVLDEMPAVVGGKFCREAKDPFIEGESTVHNVIHCARCIAPGAWIVCFSLVGYLQEEQAKLEFLAKILWQC